MKFLDLNELPPIPITKDPDEYAHHLMLQALSKPSLLVDNLQTNLKAAVIGNDVLPVAINESAYNTTHVCSIYTTYFSYAREEIQSIDNKFLRPLLLGFISCLGQLLKSAKIDRVASHNNFFLATSLYPAAEVSFDRLAKYIQTLSETHRDHAILFRSLNTHTNEGLMHSLKRAGCKLVPARQIYLFDCKLKNYTSYRPYRVDLKLLNENKNFTLCRNCEIDENDYDRITLLYKKLYIEKHSIFNPQFNRNYIKQSHQNGFIKYYGLRNVSGVLDGVIGFYDRHRVTSTPIVGYDTDLPQELGLYRMLMAHALFRAHNKGMILNLSSGASQFKMRRGAVPFVEYNAIYTKHLNSRFQKLTWSFLSAVLKYAGLPVMKKFI